jgi:iron-regulated transporter 1
MSENTPLLGSPGIKPRMSNYIYFSHFLSTWNARVLEYGAVLFLAELLPDTFLPLSLYALFRSFSAILLSHKLGVYIDSTNRLEVIRGSIVYQRIAVISTCFLFYLMIVVGVDSSYFNIFLGLLIGFACIERLCATMNMVSVERDWVVVIADGDMNFLQRLNAKMRRIDLFCKLLGPLAISYFDVWFNIKDLVLLLLVWNFLSMFFEYYTIACVYRTYPKLKESKHRPITTTQDENDNNWLQYHIIKPFKFYVHHPMFLPSFSLSILYMTVLSFGPQMIAYLLFEGRDASQVGIMRTVSVVVELLTTFVAPRIMSRTGPVRAGSGFIVWQSLCLSIGIYTSLFLGGVAAKAETMYLITAVILSRIGLWGFDLCVQLIIQHGVEHENSAKFSSIEAGFQSLFELLSFVQTIVWTRPDQFVYPVVLSGGSTVIACVLFLVFHATRGHAQ